MVSDLPVAAGQQQPTPRNPATACTADRPRRLPAGPPRFPARAHRSAARLPQAALHVGERFAQLYENAARLYQLHSVKRRFQANTPAEQSLHADRKCPQLGHRASRPGTDHHRRHRAPLPRRTAQSPHPRHPARHAAAGHCSACWSATQPPSTASPSNSRVGGQPARHRRHHRPDQLASTPTTASTSPCSHPRPRPCSMAAPWPPCPSPWPTSSSPCAPTRRSPSTASPPSPPGLGPRRRHASPASRFSLCG